MSEPASICLPRDELRTVRVTGEDAASWLQGLATSEVAALRPGQGSWALFLTKPGKVITDALLLRESDGVLVGVPEARLEVLLDHLDGFLVMEDADVETRPGDSWLTLHGAGAAAAAAQVATAHGWAAGDVRWPDGPGGVVVGPSVGVAPVRSTLSDSGFPCADARAAARARIEAFLPVFGVDYDERQNPHEASLERVVVSWDKGCYLGQEAVCMLDMRGKVKRRLVTITVDDGVPEAGTEVSDASGQPVGVVTSAAPVGGGSVAFARLSVTAARAGTELRVGQLAGRVLREPPRL